MAVHSPAHVFPGRSGLHPWPCLQDEPRFTHCPDTRPESECRARVFLEMPAPLFPALVTSWGAVRSRQRLARQANLKGFWAFPEARSPSKTPASALEHGHTCARITVTSPSVRDASRAATSGGGGDVGPRL